MCCCARKRERRHKDPHMKLCGAAIQPDTALVKAADEAQARPEWHLVQSDRKVSQSDRKVPRRSPKATHIDRINESVF